MKKMKRVTTVFLAMLCLLCLCHATDTLAANMYRVIIDANGGLFYFDGAEYGFYDSELSVEDGGTIASTGQTIAVVGYAGMTFKGWNVYNSSGAQVASGLSTNDVNGYTITDSVNFVAQWEPIDSGDTTEAITYAAWFGDTNTVDYGTKITIIHDGIKYSGYGYVSISEEIYSSWTGEVEIITEFPGHYVNANNRWNPDYFYSKGPASSFKKEGDTSFPMSTTGTGRDVPPNSILLREFYYNVKNHKPDISLVQSIDENGNQSVTVTTDSVVATENATVHSEVLISGVLYNNAVSVVNSQLKTSNILVYDITLKDPDGNTVSEFGENVEVTIAIPDDFQVGAEKTVVVYYLSPDGVLEECETTYHSDEKGNRYVTFLTDHFSCYVLVECDVVVETEPETTEEMTVEETTEEGTEETIVETAESLNADRDSDNDGDAGATRHGNRMVWMLAGGIGLLVIIMLFVAGKKRTR